MTETADDRRRVVDEECAALHCGVAAVTMRRHRKAGTGPRYVRLGVRKIGYRLCDLDEWIASKLSDAA